jgi:uncharacterized protein
VASAHPTPFVVPVTELLRAPGSRRPVQEQMAAEGLAMSDSHVPDGAPVTVDVVLESLSDGVTVVGRVTAPWEAACRRCLGPARGMIDADVDELYQQVPTSDEAFLFDGDLLDLGPMVRETVLVELPLAPVCRPDCAGLCAVCGADRNTVDCGHVAAPTDQRWSALEGLRDQLAGADDPSEPPV